MDGCTISDAAARTGFSSSALRFYEQAGLIAPGRSPAGYRTYTEGHLDTLRFIGRAKGFGLTLEEITEVLPLLGDGEACAPVQQRLRDLVDRKIDEAQHRVADLIGFTAELQRAASVLSRHTPDGPCDDQCGCTTEPRSVITSSVPLSPEPSTPVDGPPIACTLAADQVDQRLDDWQALVAAADRREDIEGGVRLRFDHGVDATQLVALAVAEQGCCRFFTFTVSIGPTGTILDVVAPDDARPAIDALVGVAPQRVGYGSARAADRRERAAMIVPQIMTMMP